MHRKIMLWLTLVMGTLLLITPMTQAQGGLLSYGMTISEKLDATVPQALYTFNGNADDIVTIYVLSWANDFQPTLTLLGPTGQLAFSNRDNLTPVGNDARITVRLPQPGAYSILVGSMNTNFNTYTLTLQATQSFPVATLGDDPIEAFFSPEVPQQVYNVPQSPSSNTTVSVQGSPDFAMSVQLRDPSGNIVASLSGVLPDASFTIPAGDGVYELLVSGADATQTGSVTIARGAITSSSPGATQPSTQPSTTTGGVQTPADICAVFASGAGANLRTGPSTDFSQVATISGDSYMTATGQYSGWYYGTYQGQTAWVSSTVVRTQGASCANLPVVQPPSTGQQQPTQPPQVTATIVPTIEGVQPTATTTDGQQPTSLPPPTIAPTEPPPPTQAAVFPDNPTQFSVTLQRDTAGNAPQNYTNTISAPGWHLIRYNVTGLSNQGGANASRRFTFIVTCVSDTLRWGPQRQAQNNSCNTNSISNTFTADSNLQTIYIRLESGGPVTYTIIASPN